MPNLFEALEARLKECHIPGASIAKLSSSGDIATEKAGVINTETQELVENNTLFQAASLSKPVFAYIVLKMVEHGLFSRPGESAESGLDRPLHELGDFGPPALRSHPNYRLLTPRIILSHQAGLPNWFNSREPEGYVADPATRFDYSGVAYCFLNDVVEHIAGQPLHELSREVFDAEPLTMRHSCFVPPPVGSVALEKRAIGHKADETPDKRTPSGPIRANPAASLSTTAEDYTKFINVCLHDPFIRTHMFEPQLSLDGKDQKSIDANVSEETLQQMHWGLGMGLQTADNGDTIAFHWGDNETSRAFTAINLQTNEAVVCFTNSAHGPRIFREIAEPVVGNLNPVSDWLTKREGLEVSPTPPPVSTELQRIIATGHVPAISYACVSPEANGEGFQCTATAVGQKNIQDVDANPNVVNHETRFPASSLSKIAFSYLVLQLVQAGELDLDEPLLPILQRNNEQYERLMVNGHYPEEAQRLTARHVLSHTTGLPNFQGETLASTLHFDPASSLGTGYSYSGEAFLFLQKVIETKMKKDLETLAKEYMFNPLGMNRSTFLPESEANPNIVTVHTELGQPNPIFNVDPECCSAGSLLTTAEDYSKLMEAWLKQMEDPTVRQAFVPASTVNFSERNQQTCGLGWHLYNDNGNVIAYQFGENPNTRAFVAINLTERKGAVFFTNSENGMSVANQVFNASDLPTIGDLGAIFHHLHYTQSNEPGWQDTLSGKEAEVTNDIDKSRHYFEQASTSAPHDESKQRRLQWFNRANQASQRTFTSPIQAVVGHYKNRYHDEVEVFIRGDNVVFKQFGRETPLVRISETEFLPEKDQSFKVRFNQGQMTIDSVDGWEKSLLKQGAPQSNQHFKEAAHQLRAPQPGYMRPTQSSTAKQREKHADTAPNPPWRP